MFEYVCLFLVDIVGYELCFDLLVGMFFDEVFEEFFVVFCCFWYVVCWVICGYVEYEFVWCV